MRPRGVLTIVVCLTPIAAVLLWLFASDNGVITIGPGALVAVNVNGLKQLHDLYSLPEQCSPKRRSVVLPRREAHHLKHAQNGLVLIPEGTTVDSIGRSFVLPGGRLVDPYPANTYDMTRDRAIEVIRIRVTEGPNKNLEGWVDVQNLVLPPSL